MNLVKRLYTVSIDLEFPVVATSPEQAKEIAEREFRNEINMNTPSRHDFDCHLTRGRYIPGGSEPESLTLDGSMSLEEAWELNKDLNNRDPMDIQK